MAKKAKATKVKATKKKAATTKPVKKKAVKKKAVKKKAVKKKAVKKKAVKTKVTPSKATAKVSLGPDLLLKAAREGNAQQVAELLAAGVDPDLCYPTKTPNSSEIGAFRSMFSEYQEYVWGERNDHYGWTGLHIAARHGHIEVVRRLIAAGADVNASSRYEEAPLHRALFCYSEDWEQESISNETREAIVKLLLDAGADVNVVDRKGETPLHKAMYVINGAKLVEMIVQAGGDVNAHGALHAAVDANDPAVLTVILTSGRVDLKRRKKKQTALEYARSLKHRRMAQLLEQAERKL